MNAIVPPRDTALGPPGRPGRDPPSPVALRSPLWFGFFRLVFLRFFRRHMRALRLARWGWPEAPDGVPLVVFANHPSWWDGMAFMLLSTRLFPGRPMFIPMAATALGRYGFMRRLGVFGVEPGARGAVRFLQVSAEVLAAPAHMLWLNAPGRFCDARERPVPIAPGLVRLAEVAPEAHFLPLAMEYPFWSERAAEMLAAFGPPITGAVLHGMDRQTRAAYLAGALEDAMDRLAEDAISRDAARFDTVLAGREGMGGIYQGWRRLRAWLGGERFDPRHDPGADR
ncbi:lysophospholipid acyltransferase family protein [Roseomonas sp. NAR14]|uniref:Lysophospholipid acyltransferase family protein n=1 Tax=Roseomonas acroporae TaxID=2937791 RepID=A0A9X2BX10_9PROT|nr:lysophospholipid acyltransferase family protein [Roseomonas acroporae]MCK8785459.1 lysophospholipid acyltransferase family protein [Roseomonas acroporae]